MDYSLVWMGVLVVLNVECGAITPPVAINVWVLSGVLPEVPMQTIFKGIFPFLWVIIGVLLLVLFFPQLAMFLPSIA